MRRICVAEDYRHLSRERRSQSCFTYPALLLIYGNHDSLVHLMFYLRAGRLVTFLGGCYAHVDPGHKGISALLYNTPACLRLASVPF